jgi:peptide/nickel transport system substrate-binding protein
MKATVEETPMKRRDFLKSASGLAAGVMVPAIWSPAKADAPSETLLVVSEGGPDIHGVGTNVPDYKVPNSTASMIFCYGIA